MKCQNCGHEMGGGKFCTNCGTPLESTQPAVENTQPTATEETAAAEPVNETKVVENQQQPATPQQEQPAQVKQNDFADQIARVFTNFGHFFMTLIKQPSAAKKANHNDLFSAIITMVAFGLFFAMSMFIPVAIIANETRIFPEPTFFANFMVPLLLFLILIAGVASLTFAGTKLAKMDYTYADVIGKFGAYLLPFTLVYLAGTLLFVGQLPTLPGILLGIGLTGLMFVIPALILFERSATGFDRIYILLGLYFIVTLVVGIVTQSIIESLIEDMIGSLPFFLR
ncbi:zinc ribbon domain-containing protein [Ornithinibacillus xuwenensis]|uniref:Zinc ribbon domain-containing protein n=1 Tax=Ornithinibacillus xuwenensis TaxID=3144668 RepID=A0ABU9XPH2_9BACI